MPIPPEEIAQRLASLGATNIKSFIDPQVMFCGPEGQFSKLAVVVGTHGSFFLLSLGMTESGNLAILRGDLRAIEEHRREVDALLKSIALDRVSIVRATSLFNAAYDYLERIRRERRFQLPN